MSIYRNISLIFATIGFAAAAYGLTISVKQDLAVAIAGNPRAEHILLYRERGLCTQKALKATFNDTKNKPVEGCWKVIDGGNIQIIFLDGDFAVVPMAQFKKPEEI